MRLGVLDVGSNSVHLLVVDAYQGARPLPAYSHKADLHLAQHLDGRGRIDTAGMNALVRFVTEALVIAEDKGVEELLPFATSAIREAPNGEAVLAQIFAETGVRLSVLSGGSEARLTFLAVRRWFGWSSGRLLVFDIGGGSLEVACGLDESPDTAISLPLGAGRLTRTWFSSDPPSHKEVRALRRYIRGEVGRTVGAVTRLGRVDQAVATSKTFKQLARLTGAAPSADGANIPRVLSRAVLADRLPDLERMSAAQRATLPGVSPGRALQILAGALVAEATMDLFGLPELVVCPWALREGVILRKLDLVAGVAEPEAVNNTAGRLHDASPLTPRPLRPRPAAIEPPVEPAIEST